MLSASVDTKEFAESIKKWQSRFGDTNEEAIVRVGTMTARELAKRMQPWGTGPKARKIIQEAIAKDVRKSVRTVPDATLDKRRGVRFRGKWINPTPDKVIKSPEDLLRHVDRLRSGKTGKVDKRKVTINSVRIVSKSVLDDAIKLKIKRAGLSKGLWLVAGNKLAGLIPKKRGLSVSLRSWPASVAAKLPHLASAEFRKGTFMPSVEIGNKSPQTRLERFLKDRDIAKIAKAAWRRTETQYKKAVERIDREGRAR